MLWIDNIKIIPNGLNIWDPLQVKWLSVTGQLIVGKYDPVEDPAIGPLTWVIWDSCHEDPNCPRAQPLITDVLELPGWPECCPGGILWWWANCELRSICPTDFSSFFWFEDKHVKADATDPTAGTLIEKLYSCNSDLLQISLDNSGNNHRIKFCVNIWEAKIKLADLIDWPRSYPSCWWWHSCGILQSCGGGWDWLCPNSSCGSSNSKNQFLRYNHSSQVFEMVCLEPHYHASVWYDGNDVLYASNLTENSTPGEPNSIFDWLNCTSKGADAWGYQFDNMYLAQSWYMWGTTYDIVIPKNNFYRISFHGNIVANKYVHAYRYGVARFRGSNSVVLLDIKKGMRTSSDYWGGLYDETFSKPVDASLTCDVTDYKHSTKLNEEHLAGGWSDIFWLEAGDRLRMFLKANADQNCYEDNPSYPIVKLIAKWYNEYTNNHPKGTSHGFSVEEVPREKIPLS